MLNKQPLLPVLERFLTPLRPLFDACQRSRNCPEVNDWDWVCAGLARMLSLETSGRGFLQQLRECAQRSLTRSNYFDSLASKRRLGLLEELNGLLAAEVNDTIHDALADFKALDKYDIYAGDGHYRAASTHEQKVKDKKYAVGHFYTLNLRTHALTHLDSALKTSSRKKEHDMHLLKRMSIKQLRQNAAKGRRVLYVWDCAGIDFLQWYKWKQGSGIYFVSLEKENMKLEVIGEPDWDANDSINTGVIAYEMVSTSKGVSVQRVRYRCPRTGKSLHFITNVTDLPPGLIAQLYKMRWDIEKVYDQLKNKLGEKKAWGKSNAARNSQATFTCLAHNLMLLLEHRLKEEEQLVDEHENKRREKRLKCDSERLSKTGEQIPYAQQCIQRATQRSQKLIRWLRNHWWLPTPWQQAINALRITYGISQA